MEKGGFVYILTNKHRTTLYIGVTSNIRNRIYQHKQHTFPDSFAAKYNLEYLIYFESFTTIDEAKYREKQLKKWRREKKEALINTINPQWNDLWSAIQEF